MTVVDYSDATLNLDKDETAHDFEVHFLDLSEEEYNELLVEQVEIEGEGAWDQNDLQASPDDVGYVNDSMRLPGSTADVFLTRDKQGQYHAYYVYLGPSYYGSLPEDGTYNDCFGGGAFSLADQDWAEVHSVAGLYDSGALEGYAKYDEEQRLLTLYPTDLYDWADHYLASQGIEAAVLRPPQGKDWRSGWLYRFFPLVGDGFFPYGQ